MPSPTPPEDKLDYGPPPPRSQPTHRLLHVFKPTGSVTADDVEVEHGPEATRVHAMQVDPPAAFTHSQSPEKKKKKHKKDKTGEDKPRKKVKQEAGAGQG